MKNKRYKWAVLVFGAICVATFFIALLFNVKSKKAIHVNGERTVGIIYDVGAKYLKIRYEIDGVTYSYATKEPFQYLKNEERFTVGYLPEEPEEINIYYDQPIYDQDEFATVDCKSISKNLSIITFKYTANNRTYVRETRYRDGQSLNASNYDVEYCIDQPAIGYLIPKR